MSEQFLSEAGHAGRDVVMPQKVVVRTAAIFAVTLIVAQVFLSVYYGLRGSGIPLEQSTLLTVLVSFIALPAICFFALASERNRITIARLRSAVRTDALTGVLNRAGFYDALAKVQAGLSPGESAGTVLFLDADRFKSVNDSFGHHVGDRVLEGIGRTLTEQTRESDICGRLGGEEFAVLLLGATLEQSLPICQRIRLAVSERARGLGIAGLDVTISIGLAVHEADQTFDDCLKAADLRLYEAKMAGRNRVEHGLRLVKSA